MIGCLVIHGFAAAVERQLNPMLADVPLVLVRYKGKRGKVIAVSSEAQTSGVDVGMAVSRARALCPKAHFLTGDGTYSDQIERLLPVLWTYTNCVEVDDTRFPQTCVCYLDFGRLKEHDLEPLGQQMIEQVEREFGMSASLGLSGGKFIAYLAANDTKTVKLVPRGQAVAFAAPFPVDLLPLSKDAARRLRYLCIRTLGEFAALPRESMLSQFGKPGRLLYHLAQGLDGRPVQPHRMPVSERVVYRFDEPIDNRHRIDVLLHNAAGELSQRLEARHNALHAVSLTLTFSTGTAKTEELHVLQPVASAKGIAHVLRQLYARFVTHPGIEALDVQITHFVPNIPRQLELFTHKPEKQRLIDLVEVLSERHGRDMFCQALLDNVTSIRPERRFIFRRVEVS